MHKRYWRNISSLSETEMERLQNCQVAVIGCGGLGGYIIEMLARIGIGSLVVVDGDVFDESNLNRQLLCDEASIGISKAAQAAKRVKQINSLINIKYFNINLDENNADEILKECDLVVDALDNIETKVFLQDLCERLNMALVYGAIAGWYGQAATIFPGDKLLDLLYPQERRRSKGIEQQLGNPSFTPALTASVQVSEVIKVLIGRGNVLRKKVLFIDLLEQDYSIIDF